MVARNIEFHDVISGPVYARVCCIALHVRVRDCITRLQKRKILPSHQMTAESNIEEGEQNNKTYMD